jgi:hypothetical protein
LRLPARGADTGEVLRGPDAGRKLGLVGNEDGQAVLDGKLAAAAGAGKGLALAAQRGFPLGVERTAEEREEVFHGSPVRCVVWGTKKPHRLEPVGLLYLCKLVAALVRLVT